MAQRSQRDGLRGCDPVTEFSKKDMDRTLLRGHLTLTPQQRLEKPMAFMRALDQLREGVRAGRDT